MQVINYFLNFVAIFIIFLLIKEPISALLSFIEFYRKIYRKNKFNWRKRKLKWYLYVYLPNEFICSGIVFSYIFLLFNWRASWLLLIAISGFFFKRIIQDPLYILHSYILSLIFKKPQVLETPQLSKILPNCIYMPHLGYSEKEITDALSTLFLSYLNNENKSTYLIYHSDNRDSSLIYLALKTIKMLKEKFKTTNFYLFQRNIDYPERNFLGKPGAYLADYQFLFTGVNHALIYIEKEWDARIQFKFKLDKSNKIIEEKPHIPFFSPDKLESGFEHFIYYDQNKELYLKERVKIDTDSGRIFDAEIKTNLYLISKNNPEIKYQLYLGGIYSLDGQLILAANEWEMQIDGRISLKVADKEFPKEPYQIFAQKILYLNGEKYLLDPELNIRDKDFKIFLEKNSYRLRYSFDLYQRKGDFLVLLKEEFNPDFNKIIGQDMRRNPVQPMHKIPNAVLEKIAQDNEFDYFEKLLLKDIGIWPNPFKLKNFKFGWETEFLIKDDLIDEREILKGGYYLIDKDKITKDKFYTPQNVIEILIIDNKPYGKEKDYYFPLIAQDEKKIENIEKKILIQAPFINQLKKSDLGYIANEKDDFFCLENKLFFRNKDGKLYKVGSEIIELKKYLIYLDPVTEEVKKIKLIASPGSYEIKDEVIQLRKKLSPKLTLAYFEENMLNILEPIEDKVLKLKSDYFLNEYGLWAKETVSEIKLSQSLKFKNGYLFEEEILAKKNEYKIYDNYIEINNAIYPFGIGIYYDKKPLKYKNQFLLANVSLMIINQIDCDGEFSKHSLDDINSTLARQYFLAEFEYGMIQPEVSFANANDSLFARLLSWAHEEFKFSERAFFNTYQEGNSYGKVSKLLPLYLQNILFKESIPAIARTHDHWEAMHLRTFFKYNASGRESSKLLENVPSNFYSYLKRKQGWLAGDLLLLELESKIGEFLNFLRLLLSLVKRRIRIAKFWLKFYKFHKNLIAQKQKIYSALGLHRILTLKRTTLSTTYLMLWLLISGWLASILPGSLTAKNILLAWSLFLLSIALVIMLPKFFIPLSNLIIRKFKNFHTLSIIILVFFSIYLLIKILPRYPWLLTLFAFFGYSYILTRSIILPVSFIIFGRRRRLRVRFLAILFSFFGFVILLNWYEILHILSGSDTFHFIPLLLLKHLPLVFSYLIPISLLLNTTSLGKKLIFTFKEGIKELSATTSTLLMLIVYEPIHILKLISRLIVKPFSKIEWLPQSYFDRIADKINSFVKAYAHFYLAPLFCLLFILIPIKLHVLHPRILLLGWPIFIWSWLLGPFWSYWTGRHRRNLERITPKILILRQIMAKEIDYNETEIEQLNKQLNLISFKLEEEERIKLYLYFLTEKAKISLAPGLQAQVDKIAKSFADVSLDSRVRDWQTLPEFSRVKVIKKFSLDLERNLVNEINFYSKLLFQMLKKGWAEVEWCELKEKERLNIIKKLKIKYS